MFFDKFLCIVYFFVKLNFKNAFLKSNFIAFDFLKCQNTLQNTKKTLDKIQHLCKIRRIKVFCIFFLIVQGLGRPFLSLF